MPGDDTAVRVVTGEVPVRLLGSYPSPGEATHLPATIQQVSCPAKQPVKAAWHGTRTGRGTLPFNEMC
jgi:hypothetical protein